MLLFLLENKQTWFQVLLDLSMLPLIRMLSSFIQNAQDSFTVLSLAISRNPCLQQMDMI